MKWNAFYSMYKLEVQRYSFNKGMLKKTVKKWNGLITTTTANMFIFEQIKWLT